MSRAGSSHTRASCPVRVTSRIVNASLSFLCREGVSVSRCSMLMSVAMVPGGRPSVILERDPADALNLSAELAILNVSNGCSMNVPPQAVHRHTRRRRGPAVGEGSACRRIA